MTRGSYIRARGAVQEHIKRSRNSGLLLFSTAVCSPFLSALSGAYVSSASPSETTSNTMDTEMLTEPS